MKVLNLILVMFISAVLFMASCEEETIVVTGVAIDKSTISLITGNSEQLTATVSPVDAEDKNVLWFTSDATIASVRDGLVDGVSAGVATITVETVDGAFTSTCTVTVNDEVINVSGITLDKATASIIVGETEQLNASVTPIDATDNSVMWSSSENSVASVSQTGLVLGISSGVATITTTTTDGAKSATCEFTVSSVGTITDIMTKGTLMTTSTGSGEGVGIDIATNSAGVPYLALNKYDSELYSKASTEVWTYGGISWTKFGGSQVGISDDESFSPAIAIARDGTVYVAYEYYDNDLDVRYMNRIVASSSGAGWSTLGGTTSQSLIKNGTTALDGISELAIKEDGTLMISLISAGFGYVQYFDGVSETWNSYNGYTVNSSSFWIGGIDIATVGNKPYVSIRTGSGDGKIGVLYGSETNGLNGQWEWLGSYASGAHNAKFNHIDVGESPLAISSAGTIYSCYQYSDGTDSYVTVKQFDAENTVWENIFNQNIGSYDNEVEVIISNDILYLVLAKYNDGIEVYKYNSETKAWNLEGTTDRIDNYYNIELVAGANGQFFIAYECTYDYPGKVGVYVYTPPVD